MGSVAIGYATNAYAGIATFFLGHVAIKITNAVNSAIIQNGRLSLQAGRVLASVFANVERPTPATPPEESSGSNA